MESNVIHAQFPRYREQARRLLILRKQRGLSAYKAAKKRVSLRPMI
jgi:hypothetical protein